jgi:amino-acid N-acetyltransferase
MEAIDIRPSPPLSATTALLGTLGLPASDLTDEHLKDFLFCGSPHNLTAVVGLEIFQVDGLLRSLAVAPSAQRTGLGSTLVRHAERRARERGVRALYLLTHTAQPFFERLGYRVVAREACPASIQSSAEFARLCPASAVLLMKVL